MYCAQFWGLNITVQQSKGHSVSCACQLALFLKSNGTLHITRDIILRDGQLEALIEKSVTPEKAVVGHISVCFMAAEPRDSRQLRLIWCSSRQTSNSHKEEVITPVHRITKIGKIIHK